jgi:hypothetical protein
MQVMLMLMQAITHNDSINDEATSLGILEARMKAFLINNKN